MITDYGSTDIGVCRYCQYEFADTFWLDMSSDIANTNIIYCPTKHIEKSDNNLSNIQFPCFRLSI